MARDVLHGRDLVGRGDQPPKSNKYAESSKGISILSPLSVDGNIIRRGSGSDDDETKIDSTVLSDGTIMKVQKSRQRQVHSCVTCHKKKVKCSREHPICTNCKKTGYTCTYYVNKRVSRGGSSRQPTNHEVKKLALEKYTAELSTVSTASLRLTDFSNRGSTQAVPFDTSTITSVVGNNVTETSASDFVFSTANSDMEHVSSNDSSITEKTIYSGHSLSPGLSKILPYFSGSHFTVRDEKALSNQTRPLGKIPILNGNNIRSTRVTDSVNITTDKSFNSNQFSNRIAIMDDPCRLPMSPISFTPHEEATLSSETRSPGVSINANETSDFYSSRNHVVYNSNEREPHSHIPSFSQSIIKANSFQLGAHEQNQSSGFSLNTNLLDGSAPELTVRSMASETNRPAPFVSALENSLNPHSSNPSRTVNFLHRPNDNNIGGNILTSLMGHLPTKKRSFELIDRYLQSVHDLLPLLVNIREFTIEHSKFWALFDQRSSNSPMTSFTDDANIHWLSFYTLYFPVIYASTISEFEEYDNLLLNQDIDKYLKGFNKICQHYNYPHGLKSISLLLGNAIIQSTSPNPSTLEMSQIIRYAKFLQLNKDPVKTLKIQDWKVIRFRRKLWWTIYGLDALTSYNFCLSPVCRFDDFNVEIPEPYDHFFNENGELAGKRLNISILAMTVKFRFDRILSDMTCHLHDGIALSISSSEIEVMKKEISGLFVFIHQAVSDMESYTINLPARSIRDVNMLEFLKNHSWNFANKAVMLLHKKILLKDAGRAGESKTASRMRQGGALSLCEYEDTFGQIREANIVKNFDKSSIAQLHFNRNKPFSYDVLQTNLIPSILHDLNGFLKYNDFIKHGKFNWYIKRTIPLDSIILIFVIMCVKLKYEFMGASELTLFVKLINKTLFIINQKYFKNEKYKRMLTLMNSTWEFILKKYNVLQSISKLNGNIAGCAIEFLNHQVTGFLNMNELFTQEDVPQPVININGVTIMPPREDAKCNVNQKLDDSRGALNDESPSGVGCRETYHNENNYGVSQSEEDREKTRAELVNLKHKIYYDLRNNFVDIDDYCTLYQSLENLLRALMDYINDL